MKAIPVFLVLCLLASGAAPLLGRGAIDLVAMKKEEEARRKKLAKSKLAVNDTNVASVSTGSKQYGFVQMESDGAAEGDEAKEPAQARAKGDETKQPDFWKRQQSDLEQRIATLKTEIENAQQELNKLWSDFYIKNVAAEQQAIREQIAQRTNEMEQKKLFLAESESQLEQLLEKARKAGVPPGWMR